MTKSPQRFSAISKQPTPFLPLTMSFHALETMALEPWVFGDLRAKDEGPTAHLANLDSRPAPGHRAD